MLQDDYYSLSFNLSPKLVSFFMFSTVYVCICFSLLLKCSAKKYIHTEANNSPCCGPPVSSYSAAKVRNTHLPDYYLLSWKLFCYISISLQG